MGRVLRMDPVLILEEKSRTRRAVRWAAVQVLQQDDKEAADAAKRK